MELALTPSTIALLAAQWVLLPIMLNAIVVKIFELIHDNLDLKSQEMLAQRFVRAFVASSLLVGGAVNLWENPQWFGAMWLGNGNAEYFCAGAVVYYLYDSCVLWRRADMSKDLWFHHVAAISLFSVILVSGKGSAGGCIALLGEALVPCGFMLFYFKVTKRRQAFIFKLVCLAGMAVLLARACLWLTVVYVHHGIDHPFETYVIYTVNVLCISVLVLEYLWFNLYLTNFLRSFDPPKKTEVIKLDETKAVAGAQSGSAGVARKA